MDLGWRDCDKGDHHRQGGVRGRGPSSVEILDLRMARLGCPSPSGLAGGRLAIDTVF